MDYRDISIADRADPQILLYGGKYYFTATVDDGSQRNLIVRAAGSVSGLESAEEHVIFNSGEDLVWAPELHEIGGEVYLFFATGAVWDRVQSHVMKLVGTDILNGSHWSEPVRVRDRGGEYIARDGERITLDMTCFELDGKNYAVWSDRVIAPEVEPADLYIAEYSPAGMRLISDPVRISTPEYEWEYSVGPVNEGPYILMHGNRVFLTCSANMTCTEYSIGLLELINRAKPLEPEAWRKSAEPLLSAADNAVQPGPGHNAFFKDDNNDDILVFHWGSEGSHRTTTFRRVRWTENGTPILKGME